MQTSESIKHFRAIRVRASLANPISGLLGWMSPSAVIGAACAVYRRQG
jgi:hypothetical protein